MTVDSSPASAPTPSAYALRDADIIFHASRSAQSKAIQVATRSRLSHMGIVQLDGDRASVYEAAGPVKLTQMDEWIARGEGRQFAVMRLKDSVHYLTPEAIKSLRTIGLRFQGRPYDSAFGWSDDRMYCSELVWKVYKEARGIEFGKLQRSGELDLTNPLVQAKLRERYGAQIPLDEPVISPGAIAQSSYLEKVLEQ